MNYQGHYSYNSISALLSAPNSKGIYYCGFVNQQGLLVPMYVGRARGDGVTIRSRLLDHLRNDKWLGVTHFGFTVYSTELFIDAIEGIEISRFQPIYNTQGRSF